MLVKKSCYCVVNGSQDFLILSYSNELHLAFVKLLNIFHQRPVIVEYTQHVTLKSLKFDLVMNLLIENFSIWQSTKYFTQMQIEMSRR
jgi:hypothetical protein